MTLCRVVQEFFSTTFHLNRRLLPRYMLADLLRERKSSYRYRVAPEKVDLLWRGRPRGTTQDPRPRGQLTSSWGATHVLGEQLSRRHPMFFFKKRYRKFFVVFYGLKKRYRIFFVLNRKKYGLDGLDF